MSTKSFLPYLVLISLGSTLFSIDVNAQDLLLEMKLEGLFGPITNRVGILGDIENDGYMEMLVAGAEGVFVVSGADGTKIKHIPVGPEALIRITGIGDVDEDMVPDFAVSDWDKVRAYSTDTGELLWTVRGSPGGAMGDNLVALGDVNNDLVPDLAAGEPDADPNSLSSAGTIHVLSGDTGALIHAIHGGYSYARVGDTMDAIDDLNNDGKTDLLIGYSEIYLSGAQPGRVQAVSAFNGALIFTLVGTVPDGGFGSTVADAGDIDGDNLHDLAIASSNPDSLDLYSSATKQPIWSEPIETPGQILSVDDLNEDTVPDLVAVRFASIPFYQGEADIIDGATGAIVNSMVSSLEGFNSVASPGDLNDDGKPELLSTLFGIQGIQDPYALVFSMPDFGTVYTITNPAGGDRLGTAVGVVSDLDGDDTDDLILTSSSRLMVWAGDGSGPFMDIPLSHPLLLGAAKVMGFDDLTNDGIPEIIYSDGNWSGGTNFMGHLVILSGADGSVVEIVEGSYGGQHFGSGIAPTIDRDGDGIRDFFVGVSGEILQGQKYAGEVRLLSGKTRETLQVYRTTPDEYGSFGLTVSANGDIDEDGIPDLGIGSGVDVVSPYTTGAFFIVSGATGEEIYRIDGDPASYTVYGDIIGDADGDGVDDFISAEPFWRHPDDPIDSDRGRVRAWSGADGSLLWQGEGSDTDDTYGWPAAAAGDVNGDGYMDVAVSAPGGGTEGVGELVLLSGLDGSDLDRTDLPVRTNSIFSIPHFNEGGSADVIVGLPELDNNGGARVYASTAGGFHGFVDLGNALAGTHPAGPQLKVYGDLGAGGLASLKVRRVKPNALGYWFLALDEGYIPFKGGVFVPKPSSLLFTFSILANINGEFSYSAATPPGLTGLKLVHQFWFVDGNGPFGASATNGLAEFFK